MPDQSPDRLSLIIFSGDFERVHYALVMASAALAVNTPTTLFFTMGAARALLKQRDDGTPGWHALPTESRVASAAETDTALGHRSLATFDELLTACVELNGTFMVCEMGLKALGLTLQDLRTDVPFKTGGVVTFLNDASSDGAMLFV
jgi:peroxiredoxin family protein